MRTFINLKRRPVSKTLVLARSMQIFGTAKSTAQKKKVAIRMIYVWLPKPRNFGQGTVINAGRFRSSLNMVSLGLTYHFQ